VVNNTEMKEKVMGNKTIAKALDSSCLALAKLNFYNSSVKKTV